QMSGDDDAPIPAELGASDDGVTVPGDRQMPDACQGIVHGVRDRRFIARHRFDVAQRSGQVGDVGGEIEHFAPAGGFPLSHAPSVSRKLGGMTSRTASGLGLATETTSGDILSVWFPNPVLDGRSVSDDDPAEALERLAGP